MKTVLRFTAAGVLFGFLFPLAASLIEIAQRQLTFSWSSLIQVQTTTPLLWIIDSAPFFLGVFAFQTGKRQFKLQQQARQLEEMVESRSREIIRQKLFYEALVNNNPIAIVTMDQNQCIVSVNPAFQKIFGYHQQEIMGKKIDPLIANPERPDEALAITQDVMKGKGIQAVGKRRCKDGSLVDVEIFGEPIMINGKQIGVLGLYRDITIEKNAQDALGASEERFRRMFSDSPVALRMEDFSEVKSWLDQKATLQKDGLRELLTQHSEELTAVLAKARIIDLNDATLMLFRAKSMEELQSHLHTILSQESYQDAIEIIIELQAGVTKLERELAYRRLDGKKIHTITKLSILPGYEQNWKRVLFSNLDITERKLAEERLTYISLHDIMTGVYNRAYFEEEIQRLEKGRSYPISILVADMDYLKIINDRQGHQAGDIALQIMADLFKKSFRSEDVIARIGGDEIAVLLPGTDEINALSAIERLQDTIERYNRDKREDFALSISIGCATAQENQPLQEVFKLADERMYLNKQQKRKQVEYGD